MSTFSFRFSRACQNDFILIKSVHLETGVRPLLTWQEMNCARSNLIGLLSRWTGNRREAIYYERLLLVNRTISISRTDWRCERNVRLTQTSTWFL